MKPIAILKKSEILYLLDNITEKTHENIEAWWKKIGKKYGFDPIKKYVCDFTNGGIYEIPAGMNGTDVLNKARKERKQKEVI